MTIITGIVLYVLILMIVYRIEDLILTRDSDIIKIELDELDRDNIN